MEVGGAVTDIVMASPSRTVMWFNWLCSQLGLAQVSETETESSSTNLSFAKFVLSRTLVIAASGAGLYGLQVAGRVAWSYAQHYLSYTVTLESTDDLFRWVLQWMADQPFARDSHNVIISLLKNDISGPESQDQDAVSVGGLTARMRTTPGTGTLYFSYHGKVIKFQRQANIAMSAIGIRSDVQTITLSMIGNTTHSHNVITKLLQEAMQHAKQKEQTTTVIYASDPCGVWVRSMERARRPMSSVILKENLAEWLLADIKEYIDRESWYYARGIPYRRGYLLHGAPGSGKTSIITALAGELGWNIYTLNLASGGLKDDTLAQLMRDIPYRSILLFEDVDAAFTGGSGATLSDNEDSEGEETSKSDGKKKSEGSSISDDNTTLRSEVSFAGLINAIDGVASQEGRVLFLTTNHYERLHRTLIRPGRVDEKIEIGLATQDQAKRMFIRYYEDLPTTPTTTTTTTSHDTDNTNESTVVHDELLLPPTSVSSTTTPVQKLAAQFALRVPPSELSMARLQCYFMKHKGNPESALANIHDLLQPTSS
eukprot:TRINITY_DN3200_c0_g1_i1.p1 TRINITY_DN3200_c0_g1~~TRINITY_DN3200_c0_g1_i1.p1  ORF type:complete len:541 (-),score=91.90 TRINITY_DN3200_c0_g1_i1:121-1743(-)